MPISILDSGNPGSPVFHLAFDALPGQLSKNRARAMEEQQEEDVGSAPDESADGEELQVASAYLRGFLAEFERRLVAAEKLEPPPASPRIPRGSLRCGTMLKAPGSLRWPQR